MHYLENMEVIIGLGLAPFLFGIDNSGFCDVTYILQYFNSPISRPIPDPCSHEPSRRVPY